MHAQPGQGGTTPGRTAGGTHPPRLLGRDRQGARRADRAHEHPPERAQRADSTSHQRLSLWTVDACSHQCSGTRINV